MFKVPVFAFFSVLALNCPVFSQSFGLDYSRPADIRALKVSEPSRPVTVTPPGVTISGYATEEEFTFEREAEAAMGARINSLKSAGLTTLGGRVVEKGGGYGFVIDYLATVKGGTAQPPAVLIETYSNGSTYWLERDAAETMKTCAANFKSAGLPVLGSSLYEAGGDKAFSVDYLVKNMLRPAQEYAVKFENYTGGKFTFESEAEKAGPSYLALLKAAGVPAIRATTSRRGDGNYAVTVEYVVKTGQTEPRPQYSTARYDSRETFTFDREALKASRTSLPAFARAGLPPLSAVLRTEGRDYFFSVDFLVENIYRQGGVIPSAAIETYLAPETFTFDTEAKKAMDEKTAAFNAAGLGVVGSAVTGSLGAFTYAVDYAVKAGQSDGHGHQPH
ncbi:MAG TPA: hypothetical protein DCS63_03500 [Elusimicrobia bacterium]|nr:hypothetical protein [Elusimicrobiota bacterium]